jgi:hypothetical protein
MIGVSLINNGSPPKFVPFSNEKALILPRKGKISAFRLV